VYTLLGRFFFRVLLVLATISVVSYVGDSVVYLLRGSPQSKVTVSRYMGIPLKGNKEEYDYLGSVLVPCAVSLFPHGGVDPCWYLRHDPNQWQNL
jgi:hypothetical protein